MKKYPMYKKTNKRVENFLSELIRRESLSGREGPAMDYLEKEFAALDGVEVSRVPLNNDLKGDPEYSRPIRGIDYEGRYNLRVVRRGTGGGRSVVFNAHVDVAPPSENMRDSFSGVCRDGVFYGRGACDTKGSIASLFQLMLLLEERGVRTGGDVILHLVVEEENGGNGTLAMIRNRREEVGGCVVMEPTELNILTSVRGAVWFKLVFSGQAGHSGQAGRSRSALLMAHEAITILTEYHRDLLQESRGLPLFKDYENPMPITFGRLESGNWPASAPGSAVLEGVLGFLPNKSRDQIRAGMEDALHESALIDPGSMELEFTYKHDCSVLPTDHPLCRNLLSAAAPHNKDSHVDAMPASCDAWFYNNILKIPTLVFGPGSLKFAHSADERIRFDQVNKAAGILVDFINNFCDG